MDLPVPPNAHAIAVLALPVLAIILLTRERIPLESSSFLVLVSLTLGFELVPFQVEGDILHAVDLFHGFGHEALVALCALMIAGHGLVRRGRWSPLGERGLDCGSQDRPPPCS